jgi:hypothetical protein
MFSISKPRTTIHIILEYETSASLITYSYALLDKMDKHVVDICFRSMLGEHFVRAL